MARRFNGHSGAGPKLGATSSISADNLKNVANPKIPHKSAGGGKLNSGAVGTSKASSSMSKGKKQSTRGAKKK